MRPAFSRIVSFCVPLYVQIFENMFSYYMYESPKCLATVVFVECFYILIHVKYIKNPAKCQSSVTGIPQAFRHYSSFLRIFPQSDVLRPRLTLLTRKAILLCIGSFAQPENADKSRTAARKNDAAFLMDCVITFLPLPVCPAGSF